jgi:hypothetical protein
MSNKKRKARKKLRRVRGRGTYAKIAIQAHKINLTPDKKSGPRFLPKCQVYFYFGGYIGPIYIDTIQVALSA